MSSRTLLWGSIAIAIGTILAIPQPSGLAKNPIEIGQSEHRNSTKLADLIRDSQLDPNLADAYNRKALAEFDRAIQLDPNLADTYRGRAEVKAKLKDDRGALADFDRAIELDPKSDSHYVSRAKFKAESLKDDRGAL